MHFFVLLPGHLQYWFDLDLVDRVRHVLKRQLKESHGIDEVFLFHSDDRPEQLMVVLQVAFEMQEGRCLWLAGLATPILHLGLSQLLDKLGVPLAVVRPLQLGEGLEDVLLIVGNVLGPLAFR